MRTKRTLDWLGGARALALTVCLAGLLQANCTAAPRLAAPTIRVVGLSLLDASAGRQRFRVGLIIDNQNTEPLPIKELKFTLRLANGEGLLDGVLPAPIVIGALDRQTVRIEVTTELASSSSRLLSFVQGPANALPYEIYGRLTLDRRFARPMAFSAHGEVPFSMTAE